MKTTHYSVVVEGEEVVVITVVVIMGSDREPKNF